ncbi:MAG: NAD+ synthase [Candidatus Thorarchaeota archaeon]
MKRSSNQLAIDCSRVTDLICQFIQARVRNAGANGVVVGISGGIDSALTAFLCKRALGSERVLGILSPETATPTADIEDAELVVRHLGIQSRQMYIDQVVQALSQLMPVETKSLMVLGNIKARLRMIILYAFANNNGSLVVGTSNKTENMVGYSTKFGDGAYDFSPIGDLYKTQVIQLAQYVEVPENIITKPPSAGLWPGQTDEDELGISYESLDLILSGLERWGSVAEISKNTGLPEEEITRIRNSVRKSEHKRQPPVILKLSYRTSGIDWLLPLTTSDSNG